jgi:phenylacetate-CoA ligase
MVADGEEGELVVSNLGRWCSPLLRYRTGDRVRVRRERCACGRSFAWMEGGVLGRADDMVVIRGNNVFPAAVEDIIRGFGEVAEFRMTVADDGPLVELVIEIEPAVGADGESLAKRVAGAVRDRLNFRPTVKSVAPGTLPRFEMKARRWVRSPRPEPNTAQTSGESA